MAIQLKITNQSSAMVAALNPNTGKLAPQPFTRAEAEALVNPPGGKRQLEVAPDVWGDLFIIAPKDGPLAKSGHVLIGVQLKAVTMSVASKLRVVAATEKKAPKPKPVAASAAATFGLDLAGEIAAYAAAAEDTDEDTDETGADA